MSVIAVLVGLMVVSQFSAAQGRFRAGDPHTEVHGIVHAAYDSFHRRPESLKELVKAADVIVDGRVESLLPGRLRDVNNPTSVETDEVFAVDRVLI